MNDILSLVVGPIVGTLSAFILAALFGQKIAARWNLWQKRREATLATSAEFTKLYGQFFSNWKLWNYSLNNNIPDASLSPLIEKLHSSEAGIEALLVCLATQSRLGAEDIEVAGKFRQAYQQLREVASRKEPLDWPSHNHPPYTAFKRLAASLSTILRDMDLGPKPTAAEASANIAEITHNKWENCWEKP